MCIHTYIHRFHFEEDVLFLLSNALACYFNPNYSLKFKDTKNISNTTAPLFLLQLKEEFSIID